MNKKFLQVTDTRWLFWCPGCEGYHFVETDQAARPKWTFDKVNLTVRPSIVVRHNVTLEQYKTGLRPSVCHLFITNGSIEFLQDSTHKFSGQVIPLQDEN